jgi:hypothetical protein
LAAKFLPREDLEAGFFLGKILEAGFFLGKIWRLVSSRGR